ncbi:hypothetical protein Nmel_018236, partial [Mimus melanotis]
EPAYSLMFGPWLLLQPVIRTLALPLGRALRVSDKQSSKIQTNATLEGFYILLGRTPMKEDLVSLAKQSDLLARKLETYILFHLVLLWTGSSDFKEQIIYHIATIMLNFVFCCADMIPFGMILAKILHYLKLKRVCEAVFKVFAVVFIIYWLVIFLLTSEQELTSSLQLCSSDMGATHRPFSSLPNGFSVCSFRELESVGMSKVELGRSSQKRQDVRSDPEEVTGAKERI